MKMLAFLINHKRLVSILAVLILMVAILVIINKKPPGQDLKETQLTAEQQAKMDKFKSGEYRLSKPKTW